MYETIKKFCENETENGLFLMDLPTGFGKTHNVIQYIFDASCDKANENKKFFFVTNLKKNLPEKQLRDLFEKNGRKDEFEQKFLYLNSNAELAIDGYTKNPNVFNNLPNDVKDLDETKLFIQSLKEICRQRKLKKDGDFDFSSSNAEMLFASKIERDFRHKMELLLKAKYKKTEDRKKAVLKGGEWSWLGDLYESTKTSDKQIIILSAKKFVTKNDTLVEPPYLFYTSKLIENAVIFIDECDAAKNDFLDNIIDDGIREQVNFVKMFKRIHHSLMENNFQKGLFRESKWYKSRKYGNKPITTVIDGFRNNASEILRKYNLSSSIRTKRDQDLTRNFLFQDNLYHTIANDNKFISVVFDEEEQLNEISISDEKKSTDSASIQAMLSKVRGFINFFQIGVKRLSYNLFFYRKENKIDDGEFTFEAAVSSMLNQFDLDRDQLWFMKNQIMQDMKPKNDIGVAKDLDLSFFAKGLRYYAFENDQFDDFQSSIKIFAFNNTPEKILLNTCERAKVVGISATASLQSVIGNFDLNHLKEQLGDLYQEMSADDRVRLKNKFDSEQSGYDKHNVEINVELIGEETQKCSDETIWENIYSNKEDALAAYGIVSDAVVDYRTGTQGKNAKYKMDRYYRIVQAYKKFCDNEDIQSFLCMLTAHPKEKGSFRRQTLTDLFKLLDKDAELKVRWLTTENFDDEKKRITEELESGSRIFLISAYATLGAGQNLQYKIPPRLRNSLVKVNDSREGNEKDFDAIYLDNPTNLIVNKAVDNFPQKDLVKFLFQAEYLKTAGEISPDLMMQHVKKAFEVFATQTKPTFQPSTILDRESVKLYATKSLIQAVGRICRTNFKSKKIHVYADSRITDNLDCAAASKLILNREFAKLVEKVGAQKNLNMVKGSLELQAEEKSVTVNSYISAMLKDEWNDVKIERWKFLRDFALQHPTISRDELNKSRMHSFYAEFGSKSNILYYGQEYDYRRVHISFVPGNEKCNCEESAESSRLDSFMARDGIKQFFIENHYATSFEPNDFIMVPTMWNNIYKGALGEVIGKFMFSRMFGIELEEITDPSAFELFDYQVPGKPIFVDFKHWSPGTDAERDQMIYKISEKARKCGCEKVLVVNILADKRYPCHEYDAGVEILAVPSLLYDDGVMHPNTEANNKITSFIGIV